MVIHDRPSPNHGPRPTGVAVDLLIVHYTDMVGVDAALDRLVDPASAVSAHYLIAEDGTLFRLVDERRRAWHCGVSAWAGHDNLNDRSIGIELDNPGHSHGYRRFPAAQMAALATLAAAIVGRHPIRAQGVLGHSDIAPMRKRDPGELFDWAWLADAGIGLYPPADLPLATRAWSVAETQAALAHYGYPCPQSGVADAATSAAIVAFQRHFRSHRCDGRWDRACAARLAWLIDRVDRAT